MSNPAQKYKYGEKWTDLSTDKSEWVTRYSNGRGHCVDYPVRGTNNVSTHCADTKERIDEVLMYIYKHKKFDFEKNDN